MECRLERVKQKFQHNRCLQRRMRMILQQLSETENEGAGDSMTAAGATDQENQPMEVD